MSQDEALLAALDAIERRETELLSWGVVDGQLSADEFDETVREAVGGASSWYEVRERLLKDVLVVETPSGGFRSRMAETLRMLSTLRQTFRGQKWWEGTPLVLDYRFSRRPRSRPRRDVGRPSLRTELGPKLGEAGLRVVDRICPETISGFQKRTAHAVLDGFAAEHDAGVIIGAGTGSGKTLAYYLPTLAWIAQSISSNSPGTRALALYPRNELLKDQIRAVLEWTVKLGDVAGRPIRIAAWFGPAPRSAYWVKQGWAKGWSAVSEQGRTIGWKCPYVDCLVCEKPTALIWTSSDVEASRERLVCRTCGFQISDQYITLTRERAASDPADLMFTTTESLNRQLAAPDNHPAFGLGRSRALRSVLLDEIHTYEGVTGAQNALLLRRLRRMSGGPILWAGLSATLANPEAFLSDLVGVYGDRVRAVSPAGDEMESVGAEYMVVLRHDPASLTGPLSVSIQTAMALRRAMDGHGTAYEPAPSSHGLFGTKLFVFTDKLDVTNRLYWDLLDAEGWWQPNRPKSQRVLSLAHLRAGVQDRRPPASREPAEERDEPGQWWWLSERLGHDLEGDEQLGIGRTSSQDAGVDVAADVVVATATLEVGYDDPAVGAVLQHKAPHDVARFIQRKGRAGRSLAMRPWTVVVLSDWGRDRRTWQLYDQLFDPVLEPSRLPVHNRYVLRMQAVYSTLDWIAQRVTSPRPDRSVWTDLTAPAEVTESNARRAADRRARQVAVAALVREVLDGGPAREALRSHLRAALDLGSDDAAMAELDALLWTPPRSLMLTVLPTVLRRLRSSWAGEVPNAADSAVKTRTPLREFVAGNLFDDLLLPEVEVRVPHDAQGAEFESHLLPVARTLRELMPGNVTRHFGVESFSRRHWVELPAFGGSSTIDIAETYGAQYVGSVIGTVSGEQFELYRPIALSLSVPPADIRDASTVSPVWDFSISPLGVGREVGLGSGRWNAVLPSLRFHSHAVGGGVRVRRFVTAARGSIFSGPEPEYAEVTFVHAGVTSSSVALGTEFDADALEVEMWLPNPIEPPTGSERTARLTTLLQANDDLPDTMVWFQRASLASASVVVLGGVGGADGLLRLSDATLSEHLIVALESLGALVGADVAGDGPEVDAATKSKTPPMEQWCRDARVLGAVRSAVRSAAGTRDESWLDWWRRRQAATAAATLVDAACLGSTDFASEEVSIDVVPLGDERVCVWISEVSPGGNGQIETLHQLVANDPRRFARLLDAAVAPTEIESLDLEVRSFLQAVGLRADLAAACADLRDAWGKGNSAVVSSFAVVREVARSHDLNLSRTSWTTLVHRLLGPGAHPQLLTEVSRLVDIWDEVESRVGFGLGGRELGALRSDDLSVDGALHLSSAFRPRRARAISNVLWPRGGGVSSGAEIGNHYGLLPDPDREALRSFLPEEQRPIDVERWDDATREAVHDALRQAGEVRLTFAAGLSRLAKRVILAAQEEPVEVDALLLYPEVVGVQRAANQAVHVELSLAEVV